MKPGWPCKTLVIGALMILAPNPASGEPPPSIKPDNLPAQILVEIDQPATFTANNQCDGEETAEAACIEQTAIRNDLTSAPDSLDDLLQNLPEELRGTTTIDETDPEPKPEDRTVDNRAGGPIVSKESATTAEANTGPSEAMSDLPVDADSLKGLHVLSSVRFGTYTKPLLTCRGRIWNESLDQYGSAFALEMEGQTLKEGAIPAGTLSGHTLRFMFDLAPSQGDNTCARYDLKSGPRNASELIESYQGQRFGKVEVNSQQPLFIAFLNLQVESVQKSVGRWRETFGFVNDVYRFGRKESVWADGFTLKNSGSDSSNIEFEPTLNFPQELIPESSILSLAQENTLGIASKVRFELIATQIAKNFLSDDGDEANNNRFLYVSDEFASCDDFHSDLSRVDEPLRTTLIKNGTFVIAVGRMPAVDEGDADIGIVRQCASEPGREGIRVFAFHGRERAMNLDWAEALARVEAELRKTPFYETNQESEL